MGLAKIVATAIAAVMLGIIGVNVIFYGMMTLFKNIGKLTDKVREDMDRFMDEFNRK